MQASSSNQTYNSNYPWLNEKSYREMMNAVDSMGLSWSAKTQATNNYYRDNVKYFLNNQTLDERDDYINQQAYEAAMLQNADADAQMRMTTLSQDAKRQWNLQADAPDLDVFTDIVKSLWADWMNLAWQYLAWENNDLLYAAWLREKIEAPEIPESSVWGMQSIINKQSEMGTDTTLGKVNAALDRANLPWKVTQWVDGLVQKIPVVDGKKQVENLANKMNNLSEEELQGLYDRYVNMIQNGTDERWKDDDRWVMELIWDGLMWWDQAALDRINTLQLYDYSNVVNQDNIEENKRWNQLLEKLWAWEMNEDMDAAYQRMENLDTNNVVKWLAKASVWGADKTKNLLNFAWWIYGSLQNYAEALGAWLQHLDDIRDKRYVQDNYTSWLVDDGDAFEAFVANKVANFGEYMLDAPDTLLWRPTDPNAVKFLANIPWSFIKTVSAQVRWKTNQLDTKIWLLNLLFTEEWQQAIWNRYGTPEAFANSINTDPVGTADDIIDLADKFSWVVNKVSWWGERERIWSLMDAVSDWIVNGKWTVEINWKNYDVYWINQWLTRVSDRLWDNWYQRTANLVNLERDISTDPNKIRQDAEQIAYQWAEDLGRVTRAVVDAAEEVPWMVKNATDNIKESAINTKNNLIEMKDKWVEDIAERLSWNKTSQDKLFQAQEPSLNRLSKERNTEQIRNKADVANELVVKDIQKNWGELPTDTQSRVDAHQRAMRNIWSEIESWIKDKKWYEVNMNAVADELDAFIKKEESYWLTNKTEADLNNLKDISANLRKRGNVDIVDLESMKERVNAEINDRDDKSVGNTYKNWLREVTQKMWALEDDVIARIPWEFQDLKNDFGALADGYGDVIKANVKAQRAKFGDSLSNYSRIKGIGDIFKWVWHGDLWEIGKWTAQMIWWEVTAKLKDKDRLIEQWFKNLASEMESPDFKSAKNNLAWRPTNESNVSSKTQAKNDKTVNDLLKAWRSKKS